MIAKRRVVRALSLGLALTTIGWGFGLAALADTESGGWVWGGDSESGGPTDTGSESDSGGMRANAGVSESGGFYANGGLSESGGARAQGAESESGGFVETGAESESGGVTGKYSDPPVYVKSYKW
jgi:hypothetical protein